LDVVWGWLPGRLAGFGLVPWLCGCVAGLLGLAWFGLAWLGLAGRLGCCWLVACLRHA